MAQINLLDSNKKSGFQIGSLAWLSKAAWVVLILVALTYGFLYYRSYSLQKQTNDVRTKTKTAQQEAIKNGDRNELITRQGQLTALNGLIKQHVYWSGILPELARVTLRQSNYATIDALQSGDISVSLTAESYADLDKYLQVFDLQQYNQQFNSVRVLSINRNVDTTGQAFLMRVGMKFNEDFIKNPNP